MLLFSHSVMSNFLQPHGLQHARPPCPSPSPRACANSCPLSRLCHPTISSSIIPFSSHLQSFLASGSFPMSQFFVSGGQSWSFSISRSSEYSGLISFRIGLIFLLFNGLSQHIIPFIIIENIFCLSQEVRSSQGWMLSTRVEWPSRWLLPWRSHQGLNFSSWVSNFCQQWE